MEKIHMGVFPPFPHELHEAQTRFSYQEKNNIEQKSALEEPKHEERG